MRNKPLKAKDLAERLDVDVATVRRWLHNGKGPQGIRTPGGVWYFTEDSIEEWLRSLAIPSSRPRRA